ALALALCWQRRREGGAVLLGLVLLTAPAFWFPGGWRLVPLVLAAHFFTVFPEPARPSPSPKRRLAVAAVYLAFLLCLVLGLAALTRGHVARADALFNIAALGYGVYMLAALASRWPGEDEASCRVLRTLG